MQFGRYFRVFVCLYRNKSNKIRSTSPSLNGTSHPKTLVARKRSDGGGKGKLNREEFLCAMFLIDDAHANGGGEVNPPTPFAAPAPLSSTVSAGVRKHEASGGDA